MRHESPDIVSELVKPDFLRDRHNCEIYFSDLYKIISKHWECFKNIFGTNKDDIINRLKTINKMRADAHAKDINNKDMQYFRLSIEKIENSISEFFG